MPFDPNDPDQQAAIAAAVKDAVKPLQAAVTEASANLGKLTARAESAEAAAAKAAADLKAATDAGTATAAELEALRKHKADTEAASAAAAKAAIDARLAKLPEGVRAKAPKDGTLETWLAAVEAVQVVPPVQNGGGNGGPAEPTEAMRKWAAEKWGAQAEHVKPDVLIASYNKLAKAGLVPSPEA